MLEIEIGVVGGEEDGVVGEMNEKLYSTPEDAMRTVEALGFGEKGRYLLAATFGNVHGVYKPGNVKLRPEILKEIQDAVGAEDRPRSKPFDLVFHGGSGSALEEIREALSYGVVKMNVDTDTQYAFTRPIAGHMFAQLRRRAEDRRRGRQQEGVRPAQLPARRPRPAWPPGSSTACEDLLLGRHSRSALSARAGPWLRRSRYVPQDLLAQPPGTELPADPGATRSRPAHDPAEVAARVPTSSAAWAALADRAFAAGNVVESLRVRPGRLPPRAGRAAPGRLEGPRADARGRTSPTAASCAACTRSAGPRPRSARTTRRPAAATFLRDSDPTAATALGD